jgi:diguanylate cyclase (GGDEF)-like protein
MITSFETKATLVRAKRRRSFLYMFLLLIFLTIVLMFIYTRAKINIINTREIEQYEELEQMYTKINEELNFAGADLIYYAHSDLAIATLEDKDQMAKKYLTSLMFNISDLYKRYDQIRLFDTDGNEIIRLDQMVDFSLKKISQDKLQNKKQRDYFQKAKTLSEGEIYVSKFDLNQEFGEVELPIKPMIRFITPVFSKKGEEIGVGIINYNGERILKIINELNIHKGEEVYLINDDGYYLKADNPEKEWGFMFPEKDHFRFSTEHPDVWDKMLKYEGQKVINESSEYYFRSFHLSPVSIGHVISSEDLYLVMHVPKSVIRAELENLVKALVLGFVLIVPMLFFLAYKLAYSQVEQAWLIKKLNFKAHHDALTGLYNRAAIVGYLDKNINLSRRRKSPLAVAFIDINDLKKMNDLYGHEAGDALIKGAASAINLSIRSSDYAARLGGDEFLIAFMDCDKESADITMERIQETYGELGRIVGKEWSLSYGCSELLGKYDDVDSLIERADNAMYKHKKKMKQKMLLEKA